MKKILILGIIILTIFLIYLKTIDKKVYYLSLGDEISLGMTQDGYYGKSYTEYIKEYLKEKNKLEIFVNDYATIGYHITDIITDIKNNKEIEESHKTIKNALIKSDLITLSIGTNDILSKINIEKKLTKIDYNKLYKNIKEILKDEEELLKLIREYCKEDIIMIGIYINTSDEKLSEIIHYANEQLKELTNKYDVIYVDLYEIINDENKTSYPSKEEYELIGDAVIDILNNNLLK